MRRLLLVLLLAVVVTACGDDDERAQTTTSSTGAGADVVESDPGGQVVAPDDVPPEPADSVPTDDPAGQPPDDAAADEGRGEPLVFVADLTADAAVPPPGAPGASGRAELRSEADAQLCVDMVTSGLDSAVTAAHVHRGDTGVAGEVVVPIGAPTRTDGDTDLWRDVCVDVAPALLDQIDQDPSGYYVNVHTEGHPDSAVRGQLQPSSIFDLTLS